MAITFDPAKDRGNIAKHGISLASGNDFDFDTANVEVDNRRHDEVRFVGTGFIGNRLHILCFTLRGDDIRVISLRKANRREVRDYENQA